MPHRKKHIKRLIELNNATLTNYDVDDFFSTEVLKKRLKAPLVKHYDTFVTVYELFKHKLHNECRYVEAFIKQDETDVLFTTFFDCNEHKFMLVMFSQPELAIVNQETILHNILQEFDDITESQIPIHDENLPPTIHSLIKDLIAHHIEPKSLRLKKIEVTKNNKTIIFHSVHYTIDLEGTRGISVLAGFQY